MADEKDKKPIIPAILPKLPLPGLGPVLNPGAGPNSSLPPPALPPLPAFRAAPPAPAPLPASLPALPSMGLPPAVPRRPEIDQRPAPPPSDMTRDMERKVAELEKKLQEEREKVLLANLRSQEEANYAGKVEMAIKEVQDKLRRDRRDAEMEESRLKLETRIQELEAKLVQERETWVGTLKGQMQTRETSDREIETHFAMRMQEMERRWMEEKAHWQKAILAKEEEIRNLRALTEKLKGVEVEFHKAAQEKQLLEERLAYMTQETAELRAKTRTSEERERDYFQTKAELITAKEAARMAVEKAEHEAQMIRMTAKEREDRLSSDVERLGRDVEASAERVRREMELEIKRYQAQANAVKAEAEGSSAAVGRLKAVAGNLERQVAALKAQLDEVQRAKAELEKGGERYKAEFLVMQKRWQDREAEIRREMEESARQKLDAQAREFQRTLEAEKARVQLEAIEKAAQYRRPPMPPGTAR